MMEPIRSSEMWVLTRATCRNIPKDCILLNVSVYKFIFECVSVVFLSRWFIQCCPFPLCITVYWLNLRFPHIKQTNSVVLSPQANYTY
jgi:hypothetical protein